MNIASNKENRDMNTECKKCSSSKYVKNGNIRGMQRYKCKECGCNFTNTKLRGCSPEMKALAVLLYSMEKSSFRWLGKLFKVAHTSVYKWIILYAKKIPRPTVPEELREVEIDEMWHFVDSKKNKLWIWKAYSRELKRVVAWVVGKRNVTTFRKLWKIRECS
ncbi:IS1 family transposase [Candidatus Bandiella euplotis]|uniref:IS1 family transposase n=1 Tax=Candidatus Bandiella euplotis TaxID=1664265 RepID=A0ABZ0UMQ5_9RICK|nr:IS1 family transposase [Candidatus Bandiella woodruffii]WPX96994.1 IS1 family transposase [Candidatus Bandiella woodruffii]